MSVRVRMVDGAVPRTRSRADGDSSGGVPAGSGAMLLFEGIVRPLEDGSPIAGLEYTGYEPMASRQMAQIAGAIAAELGLIGLEVFHSRGFVPVGGISLRVVAWAAHRREALEGVARFIDLLKRDVPIWKRAVPAPDRT